MAKATGFGTQFVDQMAVARWADGVWEAPKLGALRPLTLHPGAHALQYGSSCFEGLKAHRALDGSVRIFRLDCHVQRLRTSAAALMLPVPPADLLTETILDLARASEAAVPEPPGSLYVRPTLIGSEANIGSASRPANEATLFVVASPVGDYFAGGPRPLVLAVETEQPRTTPQFGMVKTGANYAMALGITMRAADRWGADQLLFAPGGDVQEAGASNFLLLDNETIVTPKRTAAILNGVTLDSILRIGSDLGYAVEERQLTVDEVAAWAARPDGEVALSGTAAVLAAVGKVLHAGRQITVGTGQVGPNTIRLRDTLTRIHSGHKPDRYTWLTPVVPAQAQCRRLGIFRRARREAVE